jgi:hypothetical protein
MILKAGFTHFKVTFKLSFSRAPRALYAYLGDSLQWFDAKIDYDHSDYILIDSTCGITAENCPRYCQSSKLHRKHIDILTFWNSGDWSDAFCRPHCLKISNATRGLYCSISSIGYYFYHAKNSSAFKDVGPDWTMRANGIRQMYGRYGTDTFKFMDGSGTAYMTVEDFRFVRGTLMDAR